MEPIDLSVHKEDSRGNVYTLRQELRYHDLIVPVGYESDGASVPRFFWRYVFPPGEPRALRAAFLHDYVYREHPQGWTRKKADRMFLEVMLADGMDSCRAKKAYWGVRLFGYRSWIKGGKNERI